MLTHVEFAAVGLIAIAMVVWSGCSSTEESTPPADESPKPSTPPPDEQADAGRSEQPGQPAEPADSEPPKVAEPPKRVEPETAVTPPKPPEPPAKPVVVIETSMGTIKAELWPDKAPETVANFLRYTEDKFFDGLIFHRVIEGFMIQGGGFDPKMRKKATRGPIKNEAAADAPNTRGTLAMARTSEIHSATAQFFINLADNDFLNHANNTSGGFGYCAFGTVIEGMDVVDKIARVKVTVSPDKDHVPVEAVVIKRIRRGQ